MMYKHEHIRIFSYFDSCYAGDTEDRKSIIGYCTFVEGNLVTWRSKKKDDVSRYSAEAQYRVIAHTACEIMWLKTVIRARF